MPAGKVPADRVVALPRLRGRPIEGVPHDADGFIEVDPLGQVHGLDDLYAAGDVTAGSIKQGGVATQQADTVAAAIAARFGAAVQPEPFRPVLRGTLLTGDGARYMRSEVAGGAGERSEVSAQILWWPDGQDSWAPPLPLSRPARAPDRAGKAAHGRRDSRRRRTALEAGPRAHGDTE